MIYYVYDKDGQIICKSSAPVDDDWAAENGYQVRVVDDDEDET